MHILRSTARLLVVFLLLVAGTVFSSPALCAPAGDGAGDGTSDAAEESPSPGTAAPAASTLPPVNVTVEGSLPYIPTSNTILTRLPLMLRLTPANVGTVGEQLMHEQSAFILGDALLNVSGLNVQTQSGVTDFFVIRGFDSLSSSLVLTDGASEPEATFYQMYNVERVEVLKGPGGLLYGSNPLAGAVNIVRRQPQPGTFGRAAVSAGSFGTYDGTVDYNKASADGTLAFRLNSTWGQSDYWRDDKENRNLAVNPAFTWRIGENSSLNVNLEYVDSDYSPDSGLPLFNGEIPDVPRERSYQTSFDTSDQQLARAQIDYDVKLSNSWRLRNKTYYRDLDWTADGTLITGVSSSTGRPEVQRALQLLDDQQRFLSNQIEGILSAHTGAVKHEIVAGLETSRFGDDFTLDVAFLPSIDLFNPVETAQKPFASMPLAKGDWKSVVLAPYVIDQITFSEHFSALAGARLDVIDFDDDVPVSSRPSCAASPQDDACVTSRRDSELSPMGGVVYSPSKSLSFYASAARAFAPPSDRLMRERQPERSRQYEVGAKVERFGGKLQLTIAAYRMERDNIPIVDDNGFTQQAGDQLSRGIEVEFAAEPFNRLRTFLSYAYNDSELTRFTEQLVVGFDPNTFTPIFATFDRSDNTPAFAPRHILNAWVSKGLPGGWNVAGGGRVVSDQFIAEDNAFAIHSYALLDAAVSYTRGDWEFSLNLKNLADRDYETRGFGSSSVIPAQPFSAYAGAQFRF